MNQQLGWFFNTLLYCFYIIIDETGLSLLLLLLLFQNKRTGPNLEDLEFESLAFGTTVQLFDSKNHVSFFLISCPSQIEKKVISQNIF